MYKFLCNQFDWATFAGYLHGNRRGQLMTHRSLNLSRGILKEILHIEYKRKIWEYRQTLTIFKKSRPVKDGTSVKKPVSLETKGTQTDFVTEIVLPTNTNKHYPLPTNNVNTMNTDTTITTNKDITNTDKTFFRK